MSWIVSTKSRADKALSRFPKKDYVAISIAIGEMTTDPFSGDIEKMKGEESYKRRVRNYRIKFEINQDSKTVYIYDIERRTSTTYRKR